MMDFVKFSDGVSVSIRNCLMYAVFSDGVSVSITDFVKGTKDNSIWYKLILLTAKSLQQGRVVSPALRPLPRLGQ